MRRTTTTTIACLAAWTSLVACGASDSSQPVADATIPAGDATVPAHDTTGPAGDVTFDTNPAPPQPDAGAPADSQPPAPDLPPPPPPLPAGAVGSPCIKGNTCDHGICIRLQGGYCSKDCASASCPSGTKCGAIKGVKETDKACFRACTKDQDCRQNEGYGCSPSGICWPLPAPAWDPSVGPGDCTVHWGNAGDGLSPCDATKDTYIVIRKGARNLALCEAGKHVKSYKVGLGFAPMGDKVQSGDGKTPEGVFYVSRLHPASSFYLALVVSYPDKQDAARGYADGLITSAEKATIDAAQDTCTEPPYSTSLGGLIEVHGWGGAKDWTAGCIAIEDSEMDELWAVVQTRDTVVIRP